MTNIENTIENTENQKEKKLFLNLNDIDGKFHINDEDGFSFGDGYEITDAIQHARMVTDEPIDIGDAYDGFSRLCVSEKPQGAIVDSESFIAALAEIGGMKVTKLFDDNMHFIGYTMEPIDKELREFLAAESASEEYEAEIVNAMGSYMEDE